MYSRDETCSRLKAEYLRQVERVLSSVKSPRVRQVIEDIRLHLDQRFAELEPGQRTAENLQAIIAEMGSPSDYAELLASDNAPLSRKAWGKYLLGAGLATVIVVTAILLTTTVSWHAQPASPEEFQHDFRKKIAKLNIDTAARSDYDAGGGRKVVKKTEIPGGSTVDENGRIVDRIDYPFVNDPRVLGAWESVDFVKAIEDFDPRVKPLKADLYLKQFSILEDGKSNRSFTWTKGLIIHPRDKTAAKYHIREINGSTYMFFEWKSGDYTIRRMKPRYYVLKKRQSDAN